MKATLVQSIQKAKDVKKFVLHIDESLKYNPGQYIMIQFPNEDEKRAFSIVEYNSEDDTIIIYAKKHGEYTQRLFESKIGQELNILGPYGRFIIPNSSKNKIILIAGGIGVTPLYNMAINHRDKNITLFYSVKEKEEAILYDELISSGIDVRLNCSKTDGRLTVNEVYSGNDAIYYVCGPASMISQFRESLIKLGVDENNIRSEDFT